MRKNANYYTMKMMMLLLLLVVVGKFKFNNIFIWISFPWDVSQCLAMPWFDIIKKKKIRCWKCIKESLWCSHIQSGKCVAASINLQIQKFHYPSALHVCRYHPTTCALQKCIMTSPVDKDLLVVRKYCIFVPYIVNFN